MFCVDLDELLETVDQLARCGAALEARLSEVSRRVEELHGSWAGRAADAQAAAQVEWEAGFRSMHEALLAMRAAAAVAHENYADAAATNLRMWEQVR